MYITTNYIQIVYFTFHILIFSWLGIAFSKNFLESFFCLELVYLSLVILSTLLSSLTHFILFDLFILFILFFSICDSILGLILTLITFNINKNIDIKHYHHLNG